MSTEREFKIICKFKDNGPISASNTSIYLDDTKIGLIQNFLLNASVNNPTYISIAVTDLPAIKIDEILEKLRSIIGVNVQMIPLSETPTP